MRKRVMFKNLVIIKDNNYLLLNLINFRRKKISENELNILQVIDQKIMTNEKLNQEEIAFYDTLVDQKQILSTDIIELADKIRQEENVKEVSKPKPINSFSIFPSFKCNFECKYCYQRNFEIKKNHTLSFEEIDAIYNFLEEYNATINETFKPKNIAINGGESLLSTNIPVINYIFQKFDGATFELFTNGVHIIDNIEKIDFGKFNKVHISLDGDDEIIKSVNLYNGPAFDKIIKGILYISSLGIKVAIVTMISKETVQNLDNLIIKLEDKGILDDPNIDISLSHISDFGGKNGLDEEFYSVEEYLSLRNISLEKISGKKIFLNPVPELKWISKALNRKANDKLWGREHSCNIDNIPLVFAPNGKVYWCICVDPNYGTLGEYYPNRLIKWDKLQNYVERNVFNISECKSCDFRYVCSGGCMLNTIKQGKPILSPYCGLFKESVFLDNLEQFIVRQI